MLNKLRLTIAKLSSRLFGGPAAAVFRGMGTLVLGTGAARLIGFAATPIITRIYSPEDYGVLSIFASLLAMSAPLVTLRYGVAIPLPRRDGMAMNLMALSVLLMVVITLLIGAGLWAFGPVLLGLLSMEVLVPYWWLVLLGIAGTGTYELLSMWATRRRAYSIIAKTQVIQTSVGSLVKICLGLLALKPLGLLMGQVIAQSGGIGSFIARFRRDFIRTGRMITGRRMIFLARYYRNFPIYRLPSQLLLVISTKMPLLFTAAIYGVESAGQLGLALMAVALPMGLLGETISKPYYAEVAKLGKRETPKIRILTVAIVKRLFLIAVLPAVMLYFTAPILFQVAFGHGWRMAGEIASVLSLYLVAQFVVSPIVQLLNVVGRQSYYLLLNIQRSFLMIVLFGIVAYWQVGIMAAMTAYAVMMTLYYIYTYYRIIGYVQDDV